MSMDIIEGQVREITYQPAPEAMAEDFLASLDVAESSKATYTRSLRQFIDWLDDTDRKSLQLAREDILAYKELSEGQAVSLYSQSVPDCCQEALPVAGE